MPTASRRAAASTSSEVHLGHRAHRIRDHPIFANATVTQRIQSLRPDQDPRAGSRHPGVGDQPPHQHVGEHVGIAGRLRASSLGPVEVSDRHLGVRVVAVPHRERRQYPCPRRRVPVGDARPHAPAAPSRSPGSSPGASHGHPPLALSSALATRPAVAVRPARSASARYRSTVVSTTRPRPARECASSIATVSASRSASSRAEAGSRS